jgi:hypothetical protein
MLDVTSIIQLHPVTLIAIKILATVTLTVHIVLAPKITLKVVHNDVDE